MSLKEKIIQFFKRIFGDFNGLSWKDFDHKKVYTVAAIALALIVLVIVLITQAFSGKDGKDAKKDSQKKDQTEAVQEEQEVKEENPLEVDAYEEINAVVAAYLDGRAAGDVEAVRSVVDVLTDEEAEEIELKSAYIESYENKVCYTKKGLEGDSFIVFVAYDMKIRDIETLAPGILPLYVCRGEDGAYYIFNDDVSEELSAYVLELKDEEELAAIIADIWTRYEEAMAQDPDLANFVAVIDESQEAPPAEEPTEEPPAEAEPAEEPTEEPPAEEPAEETPQELSDPVSTTVTENVRIRKERSTKSELLTVLASGTGVKVYAHYSDGWSKVAYGDTVGYCKTEFLEAKDGIPTLTVEGEEPAEENAGQSSEEATPLNKKMRLGSTVRIRAERSSDSERIANGYQGEYVQAIESYSDGWCKVEYNGKTGYCLMQYLEDI